MFLRVEFFMRISLCSLASGSSRIRQTLLRACDDVATVREPGRRDNKLIAKGARVTASLVFDRACKKGAGHAAQHVIADNVASGIDAEGACHGRSRVMDRGVGVSGFDKTA